MRSTRHSARFAVAFMALGASACTVPAEGGDVAADDPALGTQTQALEEGMTGTATCAFNLLDAFGRPLSGKVVSMVYNERTLDGTFRETTLTKTTDSNGKAELHAQTYRMHNFSCRSSLMLNGYTWNSVEPGGSYRYTVNVKTLAITPTRLEYVTLPSGISHTDRAAPFYLAPRNKPSWALSVPTTGEMRLYQSGAYDKPIVIVEPIDLNENVSRRSPDQFFADFNAGGMLKALHDQGYDVWLVRMPFTGMDVYVQAAYAARAIQRAATFSGVLTKPAVFGFSLGGLVTRIALGRWERSSSFRSRLGLSSTVPVRLIVAADSPQRGAQVNTRLQWRMWWDFMGKGAHVKDWGFASCAAQQMLVRACSEFSDEHCSTLGWRRTYAEGGGFSFPLEGDALTQYEWENVWPYCKGPETTSEAVLNLPWPTGIRRIGFTLGSAQFNKCHWDARDENAENPTQNLCNRDVYDFWYYLEGRSFDGNVRLGDIFAKIDLKIGTGWDFRYKSHGASSSTGEGAQNDLWPGSKHDTKLPLDVEGNKAHQVAFIGTFIPAHSALDQPYTTYQSYVKPNFDAWWTNDYGATHKSLRAHAGRVASGSCAAGQSKVLTTWLFEELAGAAFTSCSTSTTPPPPPPPSGGY